MDSSIAITPAEAIVLFCQDPANPARQPIPAALRVAGDVKLERTTPSTFFGYFTGNITNYLHPRVFPAELLEADAIEIPDGHRLSNWPQHVRCRALTLKKFPMDLPAGAEISFLEDDGNYHYRTFMLEDCPAIRSVGPVRSLEPISMEVRNCDALVSLPEELVCELLEIRSCPALVELPADLHTDTLVVHDCIAFASLPPNLTVERLEIHSCPSLRALPPGLRVLSELNIVNCPALTDLPSTIEAQTVRIIDCRALRAIPAGWAPLYLDISANPMLTTWENQTITIMRQLSARGCYRLLGLPPNLWQIDELDLTGCEQIAHLPAGLRIRRWIDIARTGITRLPPSDQGTEVRWNGIAISGQAAFHPETISAEQVLREPNAEMRRMLLERMGMDRFVAEGKPAVLDSDSDRGGPRVLLRIVPDYQNHAMEQETKEAEEVFLQVRDPSTGRGYILRVPPTMTTCHQAAAWIAGFENPDDYHPDVET